RNPLETVRKVQPHRAGQARSLLFGGIPEQPALVRLERELLGQGPTQPDSGAVDKSTADPRGIPGSLVVRHASSIEKTEVLHVPGKMPRFDLVVYVRGLKPPPVIAGRAPGRKCPHAATSH